ncbi:threonylcarbamoyl-AMP synthase [Patescibacteria group bacterium]|nr:threonylcarbamoyl-AMP synthase [Patescibacteria group bacterium]MBU4452695.1 threonylcarbamoyl-AMP synthase [Patescibacteria group bacterium]MCG2687641.1 threonylcarbamoyl-AMP synthase [Candidatus Parcubacteria bacterium]
MLQITAHDIDRALACLQDGGVIVFPTETSYGIGCDATNADAVARVFTIKGRPDDKGTPLIIPDIESALMFIKVSDKARELMDKYWPGALNIIGPVAINSPVSDKCSQDSTQSVRVSSHPFCATLARRLGKPIVASSANISGQDAIYSIEEVKKVFLGRPDKPDCVIDGGNLPNLPASTTVKVIGDNVEIVRQGSVEIES